MTLLGAATLIRTTCGFNRTAVEQTSLDLWLGDARLQLGEAGYATAWTRGQQLTTDAALALALDLLEAAGHQALPSKAPLAHLVGLDAAAETPGAKLPPAHPQHHPRR